MLALLAFLTGCTIGPDYEAPAAEAPASFKAPQTDTTATFAATWDAFADPALQDLLRQMRTQSPDLAAALARYDQATALLRASRADWLPTLDVDASFDRRRGGGPAFADSVPQNTWATGGVFGYELDLWGRVRRQVEAAQAEAQGAAADLAAVQLSLEAGVVETYFTLRTLDAEIRLLDGTIALRQRNEELLRDRLEAGDTTALDVARAETLTRTAEADREAVRRARAQAENALAVLVGALPTDFDFVATEQTFAPLAFARVVPSEVLRTRPDIARAEASLQAANARVGVAQANYLPRISLTATGGYASAESGDLLAWDSRSWGLTPQVSLPIFQGGRLRAEENRAVAVFAEAEATYRATVLEAFNEVETALADLAHLEAQSAAQARAVASAQEVASLSRMRYENGLVSFFEVVDAQRTALEVERAQTALQREQYLAQVALIRATGASRPLLPTSKVSS